MGMNIYGSLCTCCDALKQQQQPHWFCSRSQGAAVHVCVAAGVNYRKWFLLGVWRPLAPVISIHANTFPSLCASHTACFCGLHTHARTLCMFSVLTHAVFAFTIINIFFQCDSACYHPPLPHLYVCVGVSGSSDDVRNWCWQLSGPSVTWSWHIFVCLE